MKTFFRRKMANSLNLLSIHQLFMDKVKLERLFHKGKEILMLFRIKYLILQIIHIRLKYITQFQRFLIPQWNSTMYMDAIFYNNKYNFENLIFISSKCVVVYQYMYIYEFMITSKSIFHFIAQSGTFSHYHTVNSFITFSIRLCRKFIEHKSVQHNMNECVMCERI